MIILYAPTPEIINLMKSSSSDGSKTPESVSSPPTKYRRINLDELVTQALESSKPAVENLPYGFQPSTYRSSVRIPHAHFPSVMLAVPEIIELINIVSVRTVGDFVTKLLELDLFSRQVCIATWVGCILLWGVVELALTYFFFGVDCFSSTTTSRSSSADCSMAHSTRRLYLADMV